MDGREGKKSAERIIFIINPVSGTYRKDNIESLIIGNINRDRFEPEVVRTRYKGHATKITMKAVSEGVRKIVAVGGDGTVNEVASALVGTKSALGIIPGGSGNGLARYLGIPLMHKEAVRMFNNCHIRKIDAGMVNKKYFFCTCGIGFDAHVGKVFDKLEGRGFFNYLKTVIKEFFSYNPKKYKLYIDGKKYREKAFLITFANAGQYGSNAYIAPGARIDDGLLDICIMKPFPRIKSLILGLRLFSKSIDKSKYLQVLRGKDIRVKRKKKYTIHIDGDPVKMKKNIRVTIMQKALRVMVPD
ncbi:MAG: diacylglycerol kinase family lipid kinase [Bacteroidales bacterium]|nr:diacylglycerol kinase family lipid kinase [Bacteroidales bacterium]